MKKIKGNKGFTLIEVLVAMSIIMLIALALFKVINTSIIMNSKNERDIEAMNIAQTIMEDIREQIKDTKEEDIQLIDKDNETVDLEIDDDNIFKVQRENIVYDVNVNLEREELYTDAYMYDVDITINAENKSISKKDSNLKTKIFGR